MDDLRSLNENFEINHFKNKVIYVEMAFLKGVSIKKRLSQ